MEGSSKMINSNYIAYDGDCPVCKSFITFSRMKDKFKFKLYNLRENTKLKKQLFSRGFDLNEGMILFFEGEYYFGSDAIKMISILGTKNNLQTSIYRIIFGGKKRANFIYPILKLGRSVLLMILGKKK